jgi:aspartate-semialdehyde dehydrogenase
MKRVGLIGWRGMVGSVLMQRMLEEQDFDLIEPVFFTTSNVVAKARPWARTLLRSRTLTALKS